MGKKDGRENVCIPGCQGKGDESPAWNGGSEDVDRRLDLPNTDGVAPRHRFGIRQHHGEDGQRTPAGKVDHVMEHAEGDQERIEEDHENRPVDRSKRN